jgi:hypothetical protein
MCSFLHPLCLHWPLQPRLLLSPLLSPLLLLLLMLPSLLLLMLLQMWFLLLAMVLLLAWVHRVCTLVHPTNPLMPCWSQIQSTTNRLSMVETVQPYCLRPHRLLIGLMLLVLSMVAMH